MPGELPAYSPFFLESFIHLSETMSEMMMSVQMAETLLRRGFSAPGSGPIDIFGVAAAVAAGLPFHLPLNTECLLASLDREWLMWLTVLLKHLVVLTVLLHVAFVTCALAQFAGLLTHFSKASSCCTGILVGQAYHHSSVQHISAVFDFQQIWVMHPQVRKLLGTLMKTLCPKRPFCRKPMSCSKAHLRHRKSLNGMFNQGNAQPSSSLWSARGILVATCLTYT